MAKVAAVIAAKVAAVIAAKIGSDSGSGDTSSGGGKCGSSGKSTFHWYCEGTHHHCLKGEDKCLLFGGRQS